MSVRESLERSVRTRSLAGDGRAGAFPRDQAWRLQRDFLLERWRLLMVAWLLLLSPVLLVWWFVPPFLQGLVLGGVVVGASAALWALVVSSTGTAPKAMGRQAEQWTAQELRRVRRADWRLVNHFTLSAQGDVDHLMVGPGGVLVVETKWSATPWLEPEMGRRITHAQEQAAARARQVRLWGPVKASGLPVHAVVVLWGGGVRRTASADFTGLGDGARVLPGTELREWVRGLTPAVGLEPTAAEALWGVVQKRCRDREEWEEKNQATLRTPEQWMRRVVAWFVTTWLVLFGYLEAAVGLGLGWGAAGGVVVAVAGWLGFQRLPRRSLLRAVALGAVTGAVVGLVFFGVLKVVATA